MGKLMFEFKVRDLNSQYTNSWQVGFQSAHTIDEARATLKARYETKFGRELKAEDIVLKDMNTSEERFNDDGERYGWD